MACRTPYSMRVCKYRKTGAWDINTLSAERSLRIYYSVLFISLVKETHTALGLFSRGCKIQVREPVALSGRSQTLWLWKLNTDVVFL